VSLIEPLTSGGSQLLELSLQYASFVAHQLQSTLLSAVLIAVFTFAELVRPAPHRATLRGRMLNILIGLIISVCAFFLTLVLGWLAQRVWRGGLIGLLFPGWHGAGLLGLILSVFVYGATWDFFQYWFHRWQHEWSVLWPSHRVHHSDSAITTTTALRRSILELFLIFVFILVPTIIVAGVDEMAAPIAFSIFYGWGFFNHANVRLTLGPLTPVLSGPQWHRLHHGIDAEHRDQNYAAYFPILDIVFGTYRAPRKDEYPATGVADAFATAHPLQDCFCPTRR
jgi:sterol desaturase/sphingolipid hydroxylase (fatty acid hydroxylase superfamily)